jgi:hypothetical protein
LLTHWQSWELRDEIVRDTFATFGQAFLVELQSRLTDLSRMAALRPSKKPDYFRAMAAIVAQPSLLEDAVECSRGSVASYLGSRNAPPKIETWLLSLYAIPELEGHVAFVPAHIPSPTALRGTAEHMLRTP